MFLLFSFFFDSQLRRGCVVDVVLPNVEGMVLDVSKGVIEVLIGSGASRARGGVVGLEGGRKCCHPKSSRQGERKKAVNLVFPPPPDPPLLGHLARLSPSRPLGQCRRALPERSGD